MTPATFFRQPRLYRRRGFSLIEALIALSITSIAGSVLLLSVQSSLDTTIEAVEQTIADGVAQQVVDEILTKRYVGPAENPLTGILGALNNELQNLGTSLFDDTDDFAGFIAQPLPDQYGEMLGTGNDNGGLRPQNFRIRGDYFQNWRVRVEVYHVNADNHLAISTSATNFRMIEVTVELMRTGGAALPLANRKRLIAYIPPPT